MSVGRPRASSRETLAEAACELFLERGFEATSILDITSRAGVSRSSFFNYFGSKSDVLWAALDERIVRVEHALRDDVSADAASAVHDVLLGVGDGFAPDSLALAIVNADAMGLPGELAREAAQRRARIAMAVSTRLRRADVAAIEADVAGAAYAGAVLAAIDAWAHAGAGRAALSVLLERALAAASRTLGR